MAACLGLFACAGPSSSSHSNSTPSVGGLTQGLIAYATDQTIGVLDPSSGKTAQVAALPTGSAFRVSGPVWGPEPGVGYPVLYFTIHDDRPAERRTTPGVVPYDWLFRLDPFTGALDPLAATQDSQSEGPIGLFANGHYLVLTLGCCATYEVDALDLTQPAGPLKILSRPPDAAAFFTEGAAPGASGLIAVREFGNGLWYWLNADAGVLNPFPLNLGPDDGPIAITADGTMVAVALPDHGAVIEPINVALPLASPSPATSTATAGTATPRATPSPSPSSASPSPSAAPRRVDSRLSHPDALAWSPDAQQLALAINGGIEIYRAASSDGTAPAAKYLTGTNVSSLDWSGVISGRTLASIRSAPGPQAVVDHLLSVTKLPAAADTPANRPLTKIYLWQFDSSKTSPISSITDATPSVLSAHQPMVAGVVYHHWAPLGTWALLGGCNRYRVVITGSVAPVAMTFGLAADSLCSQPTARPSASPSTSASP